MLPDKPLILVCNDDGIDAPGIQSLANAVSDLGEVYVVAPTEEQSAVGHAITMRTPVRAKPWQFVTAGGTELEAYGVNGTPADCVKIAVDKLLPRRPDLVVSGINRGANTAVNVLYSGTVSAATEGAILGVPAMAFSLCSWNAKDFRDAETVTRRVLELAIKMGVPAGVVLNTNIPGVPLADIQGIRVTRQAKARWEEEYEERRDPFNQRYFWLAGRFVNLDDGGNTDIAAIDANYVSITPLQTDLTDHIFTGRMESVEWHL